MLKVDVQIKTQPRLILLSDLIGEFMADAEAARRALESGRPRGPITGLTERENRTPDANGEMKIKLTAHKNRNGIPNISVPLLFNGRTQTFIEF